MEIIQLSWENIIFLFAYLSIGFALILLIIKNFNIKEKKRIRNEHMQQVS